MSIELRPQSGMQTQFLSCTADICFTGGSAFAGKTYALLMEPLRHANNPKFRCVSFRRQATDIRKPNSLWDESVKIYAPLGADPSERILQWRWPSGARFEFSHLQYEKDKLNWKSAQIPLLMFDQIEDFSGSQFFYMLSRNRSDCAVRPYIRGSCNPDPDCFVKDLIAWWLDKNGEYPDYSKSGVMRYFLRIDDELVWADTSEELTVRYGPEHLPLSFTFVPGTMVDNPIGMANDPDYVAKVRAMSTVDRERLERGNWRIRPSSGHYFPRTVDIVDVVSPNLPAVRGWDLAGGTARKSDYTACVLMAGPDDSGIYYIVHADKFRGGPDEVLRAVVDTADSDGRNVSIRGAQDPGQAGKFQADAYVSHLAGYDVEFTPAANLGSKEAMAKPLSAQWRLGKVKLLKGTWNDWFLADMMNFPEGRFDDVTDATSCAFHHIAQALRIGGGWGHLSSGCRFHRNHGMWRIA